MGNTITNPGNVVPIAIQSYWNFQNGANTEQNNEDPTPEAKAQAARVIEELKRMFQQENAITKLDDSWLLIDSIGPEDSSALLKSCEDGENLGDDLVASDSNNRTTTLAWTNPKDKLINFVQYFWPQSPEQKEQTTDVTQDLTAAFPDEVKKQLAEQVHIIEKMREEINFLHQSIMLERPPTTTVKVLPTIRPIIPDNPNPNVDLHTVDHGDAGLSDIPPPPPPLLDFNNIRPNIAIGTISLKKVERQPMNRQELEKAVRELICESDVMPVNRDKAIENFLRSFPSEKNSALEQLVSHYPFLIRKLPLKPKSCYQRLKIWEQHLFSELEEKQVTGLRIKKKFEMEKLDKEEDILSEIKKIKEALEAQKLREEEEKKNKLRQEKMGNVVDELKAKLNKDKVEMEQQQAQKEMEDLEEGSIDD